MDGRRVPEQGPNDDGYVEGDYDESQRAEMLEVERGGPGDGVVMNDLDPDLEQDDEDEIDRLPATDDTAAR